MEDKEEISYEEQIHPERRPHPVARWIGRILRWLGIALIVLLVGTMFWRIGAMERIPKDMQTLLVNDATHAAYVAHGKNMTVYTQEKLDPVTTNKEAYGYFWIDQVIILPEAKQVQVLVKYNTSTLEHIASDMELSSVPSRTEDVLDVSMRIIKDATPDTLEDIEDEDTWQQTRILPSGEPVHGQKDVYNYRKYVFDNVEITSDTIGLKVDFYYAGQADYEQAPYGSLYVYYQLAEKTNVKLSQNDLAALESYQNTQKTPKN
jgi:hypothetical protein